MQLLLSWKFQLVTHSQINIYAIYIVAQLRLVMDF